MNAEIAPTVFIADYDEHFVESARGQLGAKGMTVRTFKNGSDLWDALRDDSLPRVILLAALLPDQSGLELCKKIKEFGLYGRIKIILVSSFPRTARFVSEARTRYKADHHLEQPIEMVMLPDIVNAVLAGETIPDRRSSAAKKPEPTPQPAPKTAPKAPPARPEPTPSPRSDRATEGRSEPFARVARPAPVEKTESQRVADVLKKGRGGNRLLKLPAEGYLRDVLLPELLLYHYQSRSTGVLRLKSSEEERRITLRQGIPIAIDTNFIADQALGRILIDQERITQEQFEAAKRVADFEGRRLGEVLVEQAAVTSHDLLSTLHFQARRKLMSAFRHLEGSYVFEEATPTLRDTGQLEDNILHILLAGVKNFYTLAMLEGRIYDNKRRVIQRADVAGLRRSALQLTGKEWNILDLADGNRTLGEIISLADLSFVRTFQVLYLFFLFGMIRFADEGPAFFQLDEPVLSRAVAEADEHADTGFGGSAFDDQGDDDGRLLRMLFRLNALGANGRIVVRTDSVTYAIVVRKGNPVRITGEQADRWQMGKLLVEQGILTEQQRDQILADSADTGRPFGEAALRRGWLGPHQLYETLVRQLEVRLAGLAESLQVAEVRFEPDTTDGDDQNMGVDVLRVIISAFRGRLNAEMIEAELGPRRTKPLKMSASAQSRVRRNLDDSREAQLIASFNGKKTLEQVLRSTPMGKEQVLSLVYALYQLGMLDFETEFETDRRPF